MLAATTPNRYICARCLRTKRRLLEPSVWTRYQSNTAQSPPQQKDETPQSASDGNGAPARGAMSERLAQMSEEALETGGRSARRAVEEAGFDENLRRQLEERLASNNFRNEFASALAQANLPASAGRGTRDIAGAKPWTGQESVEDTALRMLTDTHKPLRVPSKTPQPKGVPIQIKTGASKKSKSTGARLVNARDATSIYASLKDGSMSEKEKEAYRKELRDRFTPAARAVPASITGLASLANERIEDAIARGQFKNLPRGQKLERDYNMTSPFIDTTEYFMNKIIQKQDIVPPWIEKQQELVSTATKFRSRLRNDWRRHASRLIASKGGIVDEQCARAEAYAKAEAIDNPPRKRMLLSAMDSPSPMSQITLAGELKPANVAEVTVTTGPASSAGSPEATVAEPSGTPALETGTPAPASPPSRPLPPPFRDPRWEENERSFLDYSINHMNNMTRSYNLMAPDLAKKPYFNLQRELRAMYADVAPTLAAEIRQKALAPKPKNRDLEEGLGRRANQLLEKLAGDKREVRILDTSERERHDGSKPYGLREFWRDLWKSGSS